MKTAFILALAFATISADANCTRDTSQYSRRNFIEAGSLDHLAGSYRLTGGKECGSMTIAVYENCASYRSIPWYSTYYEITMMDNKDVNGRIGYDVSPSNDKSPLQSLYISDRALSIRNTFSSGGGFRSPKYVMDLNLDANANLVSIRYQTPDREFNCLAKKINFTE